MIKRYLIIVTICLGFAFFGLSGCGKATQETGNNVATVNGEAITERELLLFIDQYRATFVQTACQETGLEYSNTFWETEYNGTTMSMALKNIALEQVVKVKIQQIKMVEEQIMETASYASFLQELSEENSRRKQAMDRGEVIYGIQQYSEKNYYDYLFENRLIRLKERMGKEEFAASDETLKQFYETMKADYPFFKDEAGGYRGFEEVKGVVKSRYIDARYEEWLSFRIEQANVEIQQEAFEKLSVL